MSKKHYLGSLFQTVTTVGILAGIILFSCKSQAQTVKIEGSEVVKYARSILAMEPARQRAFDQIKKMIGNNRVPKILCNDSNSFRNLPTNARKVAVRYCNQSQKIVEDNGLSIGTFNLITQELQTNNNLKERIYNTLIRLQKNPSSR